MSEVDVVGIFSIHPTGAIESAFLVLTHVEGCEALDDLRLFNLHIHQLMLTAIRYIGEIESACMTHLFLFLLSGCIIVIVCSRIENLSCFVGLYLISFVKEQEVN